MITATSFYYDGIYSEDMGVVKVRVGGGLVTDSFLAPVVVNQTKLKNSNKARIESIDREPLTIPLALYFDENLSEESIQRAKNWLSQDDYKEFRFEGSSRIHYAILSGGSNLTHNTISSGYAEFEMLTNSAYSFSEVFKVSGQSTQGVYSRILINNDGDETVPVSIRATMTGGSTSNIEIYNESTQENLLLSNNMSNETINFLGEQEEIHTSSQLRHGYNDHIGDFISLKVGENSIRFKGGFSYTITAQFIYK